jgi:hypothetical protein
MKSLGLFPWSLHHPWSLFGFWYHLMDLLHLIRLCCVFLEQRAQWPFVY